MIAMTSARIVEYLKTSHKITKNEAIRTQYGLELLISFLITVVMLGIWGQILDCMLQMTLFATSFALLRMYSGGWHASTHRRCIISFTVLASFVSVTADRGLLPMISSNPARWLVMVASFLLICLLSPVDSKEKPLSEIKKSEMRMMSISIAVIEVGAAIVLQWNGYIELSVVVVSAIATQAISLIPPAMVQWEK